MEYITLNNGLKMPSLGLGTSACPPTAPPSAASSPPSGPGYRHIDTAHGYLNEREVGEAIRESGVKREDIWLTTKIWPTEYPDAEAAVDRALERLGVEYLDPRLPAPLPRRRQGRLEGSRERRAPRQGAQHRHQQL